MKQEEIAEALQTLGVQTGHIVEVGLAEYRKDPLLLVKTGDDITQLRHGVLTADLHNEKSVIDPAKIYERKQ